MMTLKEAALYRLVRPKMAHQLPGRVRLHLPVLRRLPEGEGELVDLVARLLAAPEAIRRVEPNRITGSAVVRYDADRVSAGDVLAYAEAVTRLAVANRAALAGLPRERYAEVEPKLAAWLRQTVTDRLRMTDAPRIPDDVLA
jgi:hypothetical protein